MGKEQFFLFHTQKKSNRPHQHHTWETTKSWSSTWEEFPVSRRKQKCLLNLHRMAIAPSTWWRTPPWLNLATKKTQLVRSSACIISIASRAVPALLSCDMPVKHPTTPPAQKNSQQKSHRRYHCINHILPCISSYVFYYCTQETTLGGNSDGDSADSAETQVRLLFKMSEASLLLTTFNHI